MPLVVAMHVVPTGDLIEHDTGDEPCVCGATTEWVIGPDGGHGKMITHYSLDGRELHERDHGTAH
jgi:hypothetical protein